MIKLLKVVSNNTYTDKQGKERYQIHRYIVLEGGARILINPVFNDGYTLFDAFAEVENNVRKKQPNEK